MAVVDPPLSALSMVLGPKDQPGQFHATFATGNTDRLRTTMTEHVTQRTKNRPGDRQGGYRGGHKVEAGCQGSGLAGAW